MPKAIEDHTTPRRALLGAALALPAVAAVPALAAAAAPDAELIGACAEFERLNRAQARLYESCETREEEIRAEPMHKAISQRMHEVAEVISARPARTAAGVRARATAIAAFAPDFADGTFEGGGMLADLLASAFSDMSRLA